MPTRLLLVTALLLLAPDSASAEWQIRPFVGFTFAGSTTFVNPEKGVEGQNPVYGVAGGWLGEIFGLEGDFGRSPGFFQSDDAPEELVISSSVLTVMGNVVVALPRTMAEYTLRPYFSGGGGLMRVNSVGRFEILPTHRTLPAINFGGGVTGFLSHRIGLSWDLRRFSTMRGEGETLGNSFGEERLTFWRATMAVAVRY
jgi:hypothetical protein